MLKNFRSKYVGEPSNLERVLAVLRAMGPVVVVVDEADAALGSRESEGDSGTSSRVFGMIAARRWWGDTRYRCAIIWMLADRAPIADRPEAAGRAEVQHLRPSDPTMKRNSGRCS